ncbi:GHKL domain-containing protein [Paenibacillus ginsengarvi]|uniref:histidine kinase n=1 Tax=Paenibacillus ginsengarvi TaxID=400777 RepID=A0A3B0CD88_9BACL|nr:GHKL domain-containing protein [Paenibacillus ginsengarvi]
MRSRFFYIVFACVLLILCINNVLFYVTTKNRLVGSVEQQSLMAAGNLRNAIDRYKASVNYVEDMIGQQLRLAAIAAKDRLDPKAANVTAEQLTQLSLELGISHITLLQPRGDDIVGVQSSDPKELDMSTKHWNYWYTAFRQLLQNNNVSIPEGQKLPNYWSGPIAHADSDPSKIDKWGYFYDGTTDYIINPYVEDIQIKQYEALAGPDVILNKTILDNPSILEMTGFNYNTFGYPLKVSRSQSGNDYIALASRPIWFGTYSYADRDNDIVNVREAIELKKPITRTTILNGKKVIKSFIPVTYDDSALSVENYPYVIGVVFDYNGISQMLNDQARSLINRILILTIASLIVLIVVFRMIRQNKEEAIRITQEAYIDEMNDMFTTIRGQRHDFLNHVQTIHTFLQMKKYDDLQRYTGELIGGIRQINDIIQIGHPAVAALVQSKVVTAMDKNIDFRHEFEPIGNLDLGVTSVDIVIIIGNLVDNAFDEVAKLPVSERWVELRGWHQAGNLVVSVRNPGRTICDEEKERLFVPGYSTKRPDDHSGLGLAITKKRVDSYKGSITIESDEEHGTTFTVSMPIQRMVRSS